MSVHFNTFYFKIQTLPVENPGQALLGGSRVSFGRSSNPSPPRLAAALPPPAQGFRDDEMKRTESPGMPGYHCTILFPDEDTGPREDRQSGQSWD